jgi:hypothetical protein
MEARQQSKGNNLYKERMYKVIAELFEKTGANNPTYSETQKATDILEVLSTLLAFTIYNSCPTAETIRDASEATYFQIKQMALAYYYQQQQQDKNANTLRTPNSTSLNKAY